jgi:hypothetical protein
MAVTWTSQVGEGWDWKVSLRTQEENMEGWNVPRTVGQDEMAKGAELSVDSSSPGPS